MYPGAHAVARANEPVQIMGRSGEILTYGEYEARANRLAHWLRDFGLKRLDHFAVFMENNPRFIECGAAGYRSGLYYTYVNCYLTAEELAYILNDSGSQVVIASQSRLMTALAAMKSASRVRACLVVDGSGDGVLVRNLDEATAQYPATPIPDERIGTAMLYSSGTTGQPKGILRPLPDQPPSKPLPTTPFFWQLLHHNNGSAAKDGQRRRGCGRGMVEGCRDQIGQPLPQPPMRAAEGY
jgi:long-chain acyl-CoA synthetase